MKKIRIQKWKQLEIIRCLLQVCALIKGITHAKADAKELLLPGSPLRLNRRTSRSTTVTSLIVTHCSKVTILFSDLRTYWFKEKKWKKKSNCVSSIHRFLWLHHKGFHYSIININLHNYSLNMAHSLLQTPGCTAVTSSFTTDTEHSVMNYLH